MRKKNRCDSNQLELALETDLESAKKAFHIAADNYVEAAVRHAAHKFAMSARPDWEVGQALKTVADDMESPSKILRKKINRKVAQLVSQAWPDVEEKQKRAKFQSAWHLVYVSFAREHGWDPRIESANADLAVHLDAVEKRGLLAHLYTHVCSMMNHHWFQPRVPFHA